jgi:hypothetical protein
MSLSIVFRTNAIVKSFSVFAAIRVATCPWPRWWTAGDWNGIGGCPDEGRFVGQCASNGLDWLPASNRHQPLKWRRPAVRRRMARRLPAGLARAEGHVCRACFARRLPLEVRPTRATREWLPGFVSRTAAFPADAVPRIAGAHPPKRSTAPPSTPSAEVGSPFDRSIARLLPQAGDRDTARVGPTSPCSPESFPTSGRHDPPGNTPWNKAADISPDHTGRNPTCLLEDEASRPPRRQVVPRVPSSHETTRVRWGIFVLACSGNQFLEARRGRRDLLHSLARPGILAATRLQAFSPGAAVGNAGTRCR